MHKTEFKNIVLIILAIVFSIALMFVFVELPRLLDSALQDNIGFPGFDQGIGKDNAYKSDLYISALHLRWIGYGSLVLVIVLILLGFLTKKSGWAWAGAFTLFLPVFGQFALSMFFLAGLGLLRVGWLPFMDISFQVLELGNVIYVPYWILMWFFNLFGWNAHIFLTYLFLGLGSLLFVGGVLVWFQTRFSEQITATHWIYKFSRHPQYLGWIIWSYGLILYTPMINQMKRSWTVSSSLPWLLATMIIFAICWLEEIRMKELDQTNYDKYRKQTPFLFPLPRWIKTIFNFPMRLIMGKDHPEKKSEVAWATIVYTVILILLSLFWVDFQTKQSPAEQIVRNNPQQKVDSLVVEIKKTQHRRYMYSHFEKMTKLGNYAVNPLIELLTDPNANIREYAADALGELKTIEAILPLIAALHDSIPRVRYSVGRSLGLFDLEDVEEPLSAMLEKPINPQIKNQIFHILGNLGSEKAWDFLINDLENAEWYHRTATLNALTNINPEKALTYVFQALKDENPNVRRNAVTILLKQKPKQAKEALKTVINDDDFETRFYAKQALELIESDK